MAIGEVFAGSGDSVVVVSVTWIGPAWNTKPKFVGIDRALRSLCKQLEMILGGILCTQLLSGASCGAHGGRLPDNQHVKTGPGASELADCSHCIFM
jgi:hypothetical protein